MKRTGKDNRLRKIDQTAAQVPGENPPIASAASLTGPAIPTLPAPESLAVASNQLYQSAVTPSAIVGLTWRAPSGALPPQKYVVQSATDSGFTANVTTQDAGQTSISIILPTNQLRYFRVAAVIGYVQGTWSSTVSATTASDTTAPAVPTGLSAVFNAAGDLLIGWTNPTSANFREVEVTIYADSGFTTQLYQENSATGSILWTAAQNRQAGSGTPDPTLFVRMRSRSWSNVYSSYVSPGTQPTKAVPANVSGVSHSWSGDTGTAAADWVISWSSVSGALFYRLTIDGQQRDVYGTRYVYPLDQNRTEHSGTPDAVLSYSLIAVDGLDQVSATPASGTATNAAPAAPSAATVVAFFSALSISVSTALPADGVAYRFRLIQTSPSAGDVTWDSPSQLHTREVSASATYQVGLRLIDVFGQLSSETLSSTVVADALTLADLRAAAIYSDQLGTSAATLLAALADDNRSSGGISYASNASWVRWIRFERPITDRYRTITLSMAPASGTTNWYLRTSNDGSTWSYYSGPVTSSRILTSVADAAAAQTAAVSAATLGSSSASRVDLPSIVQARYIEVWLRNTAASTRVDEFYPRRLVQSDDIEAESIRAINIAAATITADRLSVAQLSAISADLGSITAGTITGGTIQTASGGLLINNSGIAVDAVSSYTQFGGGRKDTSYQIVNPADATVVYGEIIGVYAANAHTLHISSLRSNDTNDSNTVQISANNKGTGVGNIILEVSDTDDGWSRITLNGKGGKVTVDGADVTIGSSSNPAASLDVYRGTAANGTALFRGTNANSHFNYSTGENTYIRGGKTGATVLLNDNHNGPVEIAGGGGLTTIGAGGGDISLASSGSSQIGIGTSPVSNHKVTINADTNTSSNYALVVRNNSSSNLFYAENSGGLWANVAWTISDEREKRNIRDFDERDLAGLLQLRVRRYTRQISSEDETGLIAQELAQVYPDLVREGLDGVLGYRQGDLVTMLLAGYQQLSRRIAAIERRG